MVQRPHFNLFQLGDFTLASGKKSRFKIECDNLLLDDWKCLAWLLAQRVRPFGHVEGVPRGGLPLAEQMQQYRIPGAGLLIVDDVFSTGGSLRRHQAGREAHLAVVFARGDVPPDVTALFVMPDGRG